MISKPLFKQSCKANATIWTFVTAITCAMIAVLIFVIGNLNVGDIRDSMVDMFIEDTIESTIDKQSMNYYNMTENALINYDENCESLDTLLNGYMLSSRDDIITTYEGLKNQGATSEQAQETILSQISDSQQKVAIQTLLNYYEKQGNDYSETKISEYVLISIQDAIYNELLESEGQETADTAKSFISQAISDYIEQKTLINCSATNFATSYIPAVMKDIFIQQSFEYQGETISVSTYFTADEIEENSLSAIMLFKVESDVKQQKLTEQVKIDNPTLSEEEQQNLVLAQLAEFKLSYIENTSGGLIQELPEDVSEALMELGGMDIFNLVIGEVFYRIAGLLLPIIFVIMCSNNLISSQVDSGSMAYILSTPTKRKTVAITQMLYLVSSIFVMCCLTTITSLISFAIVKTPAMSLTYGDILLFNLGSFITLFAISGICYLASCWFNKSKQAMSIGGGLSLFFLVATILGLFGSQVIPSAMRISAMNIFNYISLISLFDTNSIMAGTTTFIWKLAILLVVGIVAYIIGIKKFNKKDLPL